MIEVGGRTAVRVAGQEHMLHTVLWTSVEVLIKAKL